MSTTMDVLTDFAFLPLFHPVLYEKEALKLKEGQTEEYLDETLRNEAAAAGIEPSEVEKTVAQLNRLSMVVSPVRRSSVSEDTQISFPSDITTPESLHPTERIDSASWAPSAAFSSPPQNLTPLSTRHHRFSTVGLSSIRTNIKNSIKRQSSRLRRRSTSRDDHSLPTRRERPDYSNHRFSSYVSGRSVHKHAQSKDDSGSSATDIDTHSLTLPEPSRPSSSDSVISPQAAFSETMPGHQRAALKLAMENRAFKKMWNEYFKTFERISSFELKQKNLLQFYEKFSETTLARQLRELKSQLAEKNSKELDDLQTKQSAEQTSLLRSQQKTHESSLNALKHMKRYCSGSSVSDLQKRRVTEDDRRRLKAQEKAHQELEKRLENTMISLMQKQEEEMKSRMKAHERESKALDETAAEAAQALRRISRDLTRQLNELIRTRKIRAVKRWHLDVRIWDKQNQEDADVPPATDIPTVPWPDQISTEILASRSSSILDTYITFNTLPPAVSLRPTSSHTAVTDSST